MHTTTATALQKQFTRDGYHPGPPPDLSADAAQVDAEVCSTAACDQCGHDGLNCRTFHRGKSYRAIAVCPQCGAAAEF